MARYEDHHKIAIAALDLAEQVRDSDPMQLYRHLALQCARDPERMAQIIMCLAVWLDPTTSTLQLGRRAEAAAASRVKPVGAAS
ncbi:hypothetical protein OG874_00120 [Nocardia sp. NBC_00565]|uniref:hypothetical protein n=1 Tax=Nocardia sp. NBC_00565 TaxID=2975993 RepID=UPI002E8025A5|nr:hypothetical protein [Nocardia sp. NBC_00565]WUC03659.1 hypothetical protein OG874_00120 [Nocardia sp. NBC_00565]